ncbi:MAG: glycosyl hydrolase [Verrucomicrobiota bacterium]
MVLLSAALALRAGDPADRLAAGFAAPPDSTRPWAYWMWMDGNVSREGITADLEAMKRAGLGGVIIMEVNVGIPRGPVQFMSREWRQLFKHVVTEAERLGMQITLNAGPGWTGSGGPWVKPEQSMQHLVASATEVTGPKRFEEVLPRPQRRPAFFGDGALPPDLEKAKNEFYQDVVVLAFPTPAGNQRIADIDEKALYVRAPYSSQPGVRPFLPAPADYPALPTGAAVESARIIDLTERLAPDGRLTWDVPEGLWTILRFGRTSTGANTRPAPVPGLGLESDKFDPAALDAHFDSFVGALLRELGPRQALADAGWTSLHIDSWEMGAQNWTSAFRDEFRRRRGYDLFRYLPALTGRVVDSIEITERFLWDLRQTAQELVIENHAQHLKELGRRHGFQLSIEPYDMNPCADMTLGGVADVPMCEFWLYGFNTSYSVIEAVSVAHTLGRPVVAAEAFTSTDAERWQAHPATMKPLGDWAFGAGVNRIVFHRYQHQPWLDRWPGMTMGPYGVHWERTQTWWDMAHAYHAYLARCQFLLRQGLPVADVCFLVAEGAPHVFRPPASAMRDDPPDRLGYNFDGCAPETLHTRASVRDGRLILPDGMTYRLLVLPERQTMTPALLRKIRELVGAGATIIGPRPRKSPSLSGFPDCDAEIARVADELWGKDEPSEGGNKAAASGSIVQRTVGKGRVISARSAATEASPLNMAPGPKPAAPALEAEQYGDFGVVMRVLGQMGIPPDFEADARLRYAHRIDGETDIYFVANPEDRVLAANCTFRVRGKQPELWDAVTGTLRGLPEFAAKEGRTSVALRFEPHQSFFVLFRKPATEAKLAGRNFPDARTPFELTGPWDISFDPKWGGPEKITFQALEDWSRRPEVGIKFYSGTATYRKAFDLPGESRTANHGSRIELDLGVVKNLAQVRLNGRDLGVVWCAPWRVDITGVAKPAGNELEIVVANLWPNRLIGDEHQPPDCEYGGDGNLIRWPEWLAEKKPRPSQGRSTFATWKHFTRNSPLLPSGLLGPVTLRQSDH